jgi:hypothetical protein
MDGVEDDDAVAWSNRINDDIHDIERDIQENIHNNPILIMVVICCYVESVDVIRSILYDFNTLQTDFAVVPTPPVMDLMIEPHRNPL